MAISTNGTVIARLAGGLYNTVISNATYLEVASQDPNTLANSLYARDFASKTDLSVATTLLANLGLSSVSGLSAWVAAQLTSAGNAKGAKVVELLNAFAQMTTDTTYGTYATAFNAKVDAALASSQLAGSVTSAFSSAGAVVNGSFTLGAGIDALVGGAGDDTFTAPAISASTGAATTTVNSGDSVDGGAGNNSLVINATATNNTSLSGLTVANIQSVTVNGSDNIGVNALIAAKNAATAAKATTAANLTAAAAVKVAADAAAVAATTADTLADNKVAGLATLNTNIDAITTSALTNVTSLVNAAVTAGYLSTAEGTAVIAAVGTSGTEAAKADAALVPLATYQTAAVAAAATTEINKVASVAAADAALTNQGVAATADAVAAATLSAATTAAAGVTATNAQVAASKFVGSTSIAVDGVATDVTGITTQKVTIAAGANATATLKYSSTATTASVGLTSTGGTITLQDNSSSTATSGVTSVAVSGSTYGASAGLHTPTGAGSITLVDSLNATAGTVKTASIALTNSSAVVTTGLGKLTTIDASASTGGLTLASNGAKVASITTGSGADTITIATATSTTDVAKPAAVTVSAGAGNDTIYVNTSGTGTTTVNGDAGNDTVVLGTVTSGILTPVSLSSLISVNGGDGTDTLAVAGATFGAADYALISSQATGFETIKFLPTTGNTNSAVVKASSLVGFTGLQFTSGGLIATNAAYKVADTQILTVAGTDLTAQSASYILTTDDDAASGQTATNYGTGTLTANVSGASGTSVTLLSNAAVVNVAPTAATAAGALGVATSATISGDVKTLTVNVSSAANYVKAPTADVESTVGLTIVKGTSNDLAALTSVTLTGNGHVSIDNSNFTGSTRYAATKLATVDASALTSVVNTGSTAGTASGNALTYVANANVAETVILGTGLGIDSITDATSTYDKTDTITGFKLVADAAGGVNTAVSDVLHIDTGFVAVGAGTATPLSGTTLGTLLVSAAALSSNKLVFQFGGDTYVYQDSTNAGTLDSGDYLLKLTGLVDVTLLAASIVA